MRKPVPATLDRYWRSRRRLSPGDRPAAAMLAGYGRDAGLTTIDGFTERGCVVLLGPPGSGKSTELERLVQDRPETSRLVSISGSSNEDRLYNKITAAASGLSDVPRPLLALDSLDESSLTTSLLANLFEELLPNLSDNLRVFVACRTAGWLPGVENALRRRYGDVPIYDLASLRPDDIVTYGNSANEDGEAFLQAVRAVKAVPLASSPNTLKLLLDEYHAQGPTKTALPATQRELYERSSRRLIAEPNAARQSPLQPQDIAKLRAIVGHLAVISIFSGREAFILATSVGAEEGDLTLEDALPATVPLYSTDAGSATDTALTIQDIADALATAIFTGVGESRVGFFHQTLCEYLAARHLLNVGLTAEQFDGMLRGRGGLLAPQVQAVAAWLVSLEPARFAGLLKDDPAAFIRSNVELADPEYRRALVESLIDLTRRYELLELPSEALAGLEYDDIESFLRQLIADQGEHVEVRYLATRIARANHIAALLDLLVAVALDNADTMLTRKAAGYAALDYGTAEHLERLGALADLNDTEVDEDDELFALGLSALLQYGANPASLLPRLRNPKNPHLFARYRYFLMVDLPEAVKSPELGDGEVISMLEWATSVEAVESHADDSSLVQHADKLFDAILLAGLARVEVPIVRTPLATLIAGRLDHHYKLFLDSTSALPTLPIEARHHLVEELRRQAVSPHVLWNIALSQLVTSADLSWLIDNSLSASTDAEAAAWADLLLLVYDRSRSDLHDELARVPHDSVLFDRVVRDLLQPRQSSPAPDPTAIDDEDDGGGGDTPPTPDDIREKLTASLELDDDMAFCYVCHWLQFAAGERVSHRQFELDVTVLPGWGLLTDEQRAAVADLALRYLQNATFETGPAELWLRQLVTRARAVLRRTDWTPLPPRDILEVLSSTRIVLRSSDDLLEVVLGALRDIQQDLVGATPAATFLGTMPPAARLVSVGLSLRTRSVTIYSARSNNCSRKW